MYYYYKKYYYNYYNKYYVYNIRQIYRYNYSNKELASICNIRNVSLFFMYFNGDSDEDYPPRQSSPFSEINFNQEVCINCNSNIIISLQ